jgi:polysaccharide biosynthesis transport protein
MLGLARPEQTHFVSAVTTVPAGWNDPTELRALRLAARRPGWIICTTILCIASAVAYLAVATPVYTGIARLRVQQDDPQVLGLPALEHGIEQTTSFLNAEMAVIMSGPVLELALRNLEQDLPASIDPIGNLRASLRTRLGRKDGIISVQADAASPHHAKLLVGAVVDAYVDFQSRQREITNRRLMEVLLSERTDRTTAVREKSAQLAELLKSAGTTSFIDTRSVEQLVNLRTSLGTARQDSLAAEQYFQDAMEAIASDPALLAEFHQLKGSDGSPKALEVESSQLRSVIVGLEIEKLKLTSARNLLPQHPQVREIQTQLNRLRLFYAVSTNARWTQAKSRELQLTELVRERELRTVQLADQATQYAGLEIELKRQERQLDAIEERFIELKARKVSAGRNVTVIDLATASARPTKPDKWPILGVALLGGLGLGIAVAYIRQIRESRLRIQAPLSR